MARQQKNKKKLIGYPFFKDNPSRRQIGTTGDLYSTSPDRPLSDIRVLALQQAQDMKTPEEGDNRWLQLGPTCIPFGQTDSPARVLVSGRVTSIVIDPHDPMIIYLGTAQGGVWKTVDGGRNWKATSDQTNSLAIGDLTMDPKNPRVLYAGTGEGNLVISNSTSYYGCGIFKTENGGEEWNVIPTATEENPFNGARFFRLAVNPLDTKIIFAATSFGLYRTTDGTNNWKPMTDGLPKGSDTVIAVAETVKAASDVIINSKEPQIVYVAFWGDGIYKTENANDINPNWKKIVGTYPYEDQKAVFPPSNLGRIALGLSVTNPDILYALISNADGKIKYFFRAENNDLNWENIALPDLVIFNDKWTKTLGDQGSYNLNIAVDPTDPNIVYLSGIPLLKAIRNPRSKKWNFIDIGRSIHTDNHAFTFHPTDNNVIFTGNDGGIYKSIDGGITWDDTLNEGLCITQFEFMDQHPDSDAVVLAGTQDNGTLQFRNNSVFYQCDEGDGGFVAIDPNNPAIQYHEYYDPTPMRSEEGGKFGMYENGGSWKPLYDVEKKFGSAENKTSLFYPPFVLDQSCSKNMAIGTKDIHLYDQAQNKWELPSLALPELSLGELVSAINYVNSDLIYAGTTEGKIFLFKKSNKMWTKKKITPDQKNDNSIPSMHVWDIATNPKNHNSVIAVLGGFASNNPSRIWRGEISDEGVPEWEDISGKDKSCPPLPNTPINCIAIEPDNPQVIYIGTDIGVFRTKNGGESWTHFGQGLPKCAVYDMRLFCHNDDHNSIRLLRAVTHGRGMWEVELDKRTNKNEVDLYVRDHIMDTGRFTPSSSVMTTPFEDPLRNIKYDDMNNLKFDNYDKLHWWMCADIKVDPPFYQMESEDVDYVKFEYRIKAKKPKRNRENRIYVQIHNRGIKSVGNQPEDRVSIKLLYANVVNSPDEGITTPFIPKLPDIPQDFWDEFSNESADLGSWKQIGKIKYLPEGPKTLTNVEPTVVCWDWKTPDNVGDLIGLLVVLYSREDPIPQENKAIFDIENLVRNDKHIGVSVVKVDSDKMGYSIN